MEHAQTLPAQSSVDAMSGGGGVVVGDGIPSRCEDVGSAINTHVDLILCTLVCRTLPWIARTLVPVCPIRASSRTVCLSVRFLHRPNTMPAATIAPERPSTPGTSCIYMLMSPSGKVYIGKTVDVKHRFAQHERNARGVNEHLGR
jgi:hypothetical protein